MTTTENLPRKLHLEYWMGAHSITYRAMSEALGCSIAYINRICQQDVMPTRYHEKLLELGFPRELLPLPFDKPKGRPRLAPRFPGLMNESQLQA